MRPFQCWDPQQWDPRHTPLLWFSTTSTSGSSPGSLSCVQAVGFVCLSKSPWKRHEIEHWSRNCCHLKKLPSQYQTNNNWHGHPLDRLQGPQLQSGRPIKGLARQEEEETRSSQKGTQTKENTIYSLSTIAQILCQWNIDSFKELFILDIFWGFKCCNLLNLLLLL